MHNFLSGFMDEILKLAKFHHGGKRIKKTEFKSSRESKHIKSRSKNFFKRKRYVGY